MEEERRKDVRVNISFPVECKDLPSRRYFYTVSKDLSPEGIRIIHHDFLAEGKLLRLNLNLISKVIGLKAKVVWCNKERFSERYYAGLKFVEIEEEEKKEISQLLNKIYNS